MNTIFVPYAPLGTPKAIAEDIWIVDGPEIRMSWLGLKVPFATRMTIVRLPDGALWLHSPVAPEPGLIDAITALGPVAHIVAPNTLHYWWVPDWAERFPDGTIWLCPGLPAKAKRPLPAHRQLEAAPPAAWQGALEQVIVSGYVLTEVDFFHRASRTAILTDLIENFEPARIRSRFWRWMIGWSGAADPDGNAPADMRATFWRHRATLRSAAETMIGWNPERVVFAHGRWYARDGAAELRRAFRWTF